MPRPKFREHNPNEGGPLDHLIAPAKVASAEEINNVIDMPEPPRRAMDYQPTLVAPKFVPKVTPKAEREAMDKALESMLGYLPEDTVELIREYQASTNLPLWQVIAGHVMRCREMGLMMSPVILPDWEQEMSASALRACGTCGDAMKPKQWGQLFCCEWCYFGRTNEFGHNDTCAITKVEEETNAVH